MATATDTDIKEIKDILTNIQTQIVDLKLSVGKIEATLQTQSPSIQKIPDLAEKVGELKNWKQIGLTIVGGLIGAWITFLLKTQNH
ncbi:MAG: hypothetical protein KA717_22640 [Woronichinia naegeliana WA131]|jgi:hypothetical protein|uniref:Uncharacterized protein n=1 Tax=Woronichinia naegeliana WA131 TaxID=2824559 RepID=A0A977KSB8_9CYAN|nr:MAG: hypothetical protein KA717_22640 [Woronichinia naegeliana WA131]